MRIAREFFKWLVILIAGFTPLTSFQSFAAQATIAWNANTEPDITGYKLYFGPGTNYTVLNVGNATSTVVSNLTAGTTYNFFATAYNSAGLESAPSDTITYTVPSAPVITAQPSGQTLAVNTALNLSVQATGSAPMTFQWYKNGGVIANATDSSFQIAAVATTDAGAYTVTVSNSAGSVSSSPANVTVVVPPGITTQPANQTVALGSAISLSVQATGSSPMQFQWSKNGAAITGATSSSYQIASAQSSDAGSYTVRVSNTVGAVTSNPATVTVLVPPTITTQPVSQTLAVNAALNLSVQASGSTPLQYQWYKGGTAISGATSASYQVASVQATDAGSYTVKVSNSVGNVTSTAATVSVLVPPTITTQPVSQTLAVNAALNLSVQASGSTPMQYQWYKGGTTIPGATSASYQIASVQASDAGSYTVKVSNSVGNVTSSAATVTVLVPPTITTQPVSQTLAVNAALNLSVQASGSTPLQYQWYKGATAISGATSASFQIASVQATDAGSYTVKVSNSAGNVTSSAATVTVLVLPTITTQPVSQTLAVNAALNLLVQASGSTPLQYQWYKGGTAISGATSASFQVASVQATDAGSYTVKVSNSVGNVTSTAATVTVLVPPTITTQPVSQTLAVNAALNLSVQASGSTPLQYQWYKGGSAISGATSASYQVASVQATDAGSYTVKVSNSVGNVTSTAATVTVLVVPTITTQPVSQTLAVNATLNLSVQASGSTPMQYQWYKSGTAIPGATSASYQVASVQLTDAGSYSVKVSNSVGNVTSLAATVTVMDTPSITTQPLSQTLAVNATLSLSVQASGSTPMQFQWYKNGTAIAGATSATYQVASVQSTDAGSYTVKVSNSAGNVTSTVATVTVLVPPTITTQPPLTQTLSLNAALNLSVQASGSTPMQFQWFKNGTAIEGATSSTYRVASAQSTDSGSYTVKISNSAGNVTSSPATVVVVVPPTIITHPVSQNLTAGSTLNLSVEASSAAPMQFQWYKNGKALSGATSSEFQIDSIQSSDAASYTVRVSNSAGNVTSDPAIVDVVVPPAITSQPLSQTLAVNSPLNLAVGTSGSNPMKFQWLRDGALIPNATNSNLQVASVQTTDAGSYMVHISNDAGSVTSIPATVVVLYAPAITTQPLAQTVSPGAPVTFSVEFSGAEPLQVQWALNGVSIPNATSPVFNIASAQASDGGTYTVTISNPAGSVTSQAAVLTVVTPLTITTQPFSQTVSSGQRVTFTVQASGSGTLLYQWFFNGSALAGATAPTLTFIPGTNDAGIYQVSVADQVATVMSTEATLTVVEQVKGTKPNNGKKNNGNSGAAITLAPQFDGKLSISVGADSAIVLRAVGTPGKIYNIFSADALPAAEWTPVASVITSETGLIEYTTLNSGFEKTKFYKVEAQD